MDLEGRIVPKRENYLYTFSNIGKKSIFFRCTNGVQIYKYIS
jgi:hypothetical protein